MNDSRPSIAFYTLGCKLNFAESSTLRRRAGQKYRMADPGEHPDYIVINTCTVTAAADKKCRNLIRRLRRDHPGAKIVATGCLIQVNGNPVEETIDHIIGNEDKFSLLEIIEQPLTYRPKAAGNFPDTQQNFNPAWSEGERTRSFLKIQDGCDHFCTYCIVPLARGRSRSGTIEQLVSECKIIASADIHEIVLTGVNIGDFGKNTGETLTELLRAITRGNLFQRIRLSSIEPDTISPDLTELFVHSDVLAPHFHIPLQSGSDSVLKGMNRKYTTRFFAETVNEILLKIPDAGIGLDVICGFPGETEEHHRETMKLLESVPIAYLHVFPYSRRPGTRAENLPGHVDPEIKQRRSAELIALGLQKKRDFYSRFAGKTAIVLFESAERRGKMSGYTGNYLKVQTVFTKELVNRTVPVKLKEFDSETFIFEGELL